MITPYKDRLIDYTLPVQIYKNLTRKGVCYSVRQNGKVVGHTYELYLKDCKFVVNEAGRQWVIRNKKKIVHAYVEGYVCASFNSHNLTKINYNPYYTKYFCTATEDIFTSNKVLINKNGVYGSSL